jgi:hypothetical protein
MSSLQTADKVDIPVEDAVKAQAPQAEALAAQIEKLHGMIERLQKQVERALRNKASDDPRLQTYQVDEWRELSKFKVRSLIESISGSRIAAAIDDAILEGYHFAKWTDRTVVLAKSGHYEYDPARPDKFEQVIKIRGYFDEVPVNGHLVIPDEQILLGKANDDNRHGFGKDAHVYLTREPRGDDSPVRLQDILTLRGQLLREGFNPWDVHPYNVQRVRGEVKIIDQDALKPLEDMFKGWNDKQISPKERGERILRQLFFAPLEMSERHIKHHSANDVVATLVTCSMVMRALREALELSPKEVLEAEHNLRMFLLDAAQKAGIDLTPETIHKLAGEAAYGTLQVAAETLRDSFIIHKAVETDTDLPGLIAASSRDAEELAAWAKEQVKAPAAA